MTSGFGSCSAARSRPTAEHPETLLYNYLTIPRNTAPRWYHEGSAVFMETWLGGGYGRAQGGYDEMMFRAMVRDGARFYDPLGLVSMGTEVDFQVGANAYLYGTRFMSYLALEYGPEKLLDWWRRDAGSLRSYSDDFRARVRPRRSTRPGRTGSPGSTSSRRRTWPRCASTRDAPSQCHADRARARCRARSPATTAARCTPPSAIRAAFRTLLSISLEDGSVTELAGGERRDAVSRGLARPRPGSRARSSTRPTT